MLFVFAGFFRSQAPSPLSGAALEELSDEELMLRYGRGEVASFEVILGRHERRILNFVYRSVGERSRAEELTQDVFLKVVRGASKYRPTAKFTTWLFTIARNVCVDDSRRRKKGPTVSLDAPLRAGESEGQTHVDRLVDGGAASGTAEVAREEFRRRLLAALDALPAEQREVFVLRHYEGMRFVEIARDFGISENTVKSRMRYALATLRGYLADFKGFSFDAVDQEEVGG